MKKVKAEGTQIAMEELVIPAAGPIAATLYQRIKFYCDLNKKQNKKRYLMDDRWWTWQSLSSFEEEYPYWSKKQIRHALDKLRSVGLIMCKRTKQFLNSNKYSIISIDEWMMSESFQELPQKQRVLVANVIKNRNIVTSKGGTQNGTSYAKNGTSYAKKGTPNTDIVTDIRHSLLEGQKFFNELSDEKHLEMQYNNLVITYDQCQSMVAHFGKLFKRTNDKHQDLDHSVRMLYLHDVYSNQYPFWVRLIYGIENSIIGPDIVDALAPKITQELGKNPYLMSVLKTVSYTHLTLPTILLV